jgi:hypothetical protein
MNAGTTVALRFDRHDGAHGFDDPAVPEDLTIEEVTRRAVPRLRYPATDVSSGKPLRYSMLHDGRELARDEKVRDAFPKRRGRVHVVHEYANAR